MESQTPTPSHFHRSDTCYWNLLQVRKIEGIRIDPHMATRKQKHEETSLQNEEILAVKGKESSLCNWIKRKLA
jgi:hypothetical protein